MTVAPSPRSVNRDSRRVPFEQRVRVSIRHGLMSVDQFVRRHERLSGQEVRVTGVMVKGSAVALSIRYADAPA